MGATSYEVACSRRVSWWNACELALDLSDDTGLTHAVWWALGRGAEDCMMPPHVRVSLELARREPWACSAQNREDIRDLVLRLRDDS